MNRSADRAGWARMTEQERPKRPSQPRAVLCPYCGEVSAHAGRCGACGGRFDPLSRQATQNQMGPWFIRDAHKPFRPGCSYDTLRVSAARGHIRPDTIIRGPATHQFWSFAGRTPSVANLLGLCHNCEARVRPEDPACPSCGASFLPEAERQNMGLSPVILLPGQAPAEMIAAASFDADPGDDVEFDAKPALTPVTRPAHPVPQPAHRPLAAPAANAAQPRAGMSRTHRTLIGILVGLLGLGGLSALGAWTVWMLKPTPKPAASTAPAKPDTSAAPKGPGTEPSAPAADQTTTDQPPKAPESTDSGLHSSGQSPAAETIDDERSAAPESGWLVTLQRLGHSPLDAASLREFVKAAEASGALAPEETEGLRRAAAIEETLARMRALP